MQPQDNLLDSVPEEHRAEAARYFDRPSGTAQFPWKQPWEKGSGDNVRFWPLSPPGKSALMVALADDGSIRKRSGAPRILAEVEGVTARNYFRLLVASSKISKSADQGQPKLSEILTRELERERSRIARELHAGAGQPLAGIKMNLELLRGTSPDLPPAVEGSLDRLELLADQALEQIRAVSHRLYPPDWQSLTLGEALRGLWLASGVEQKFQASLRIENLRTEPSHAIKVILYRCFQECLSNILRHSGASEASFYVSERPGWIDLQVQDNGIGFDLKSTQNSEHAPRSRGIGLAAMREQVASVNGRLDIESDAQGTKLNFVLPLMED